MAGALQVNDLLTRGERLFENEIMGPESIVFHKGNLFRHDILSRKSAVREPDLDVSVIYPNPDFRFLIMGGQNWLNKNTKHA